MTRRPIGSCETIQQSCAKTRRWMVTISLMLLLAIWARAEVAGNKALDGVEKQEKSAKQQGEVMTRHIEAGAGTDAGQTARITALERQTVRVLKKLDTIEALLRGQRK